MHELETRLRQIIAPHGGRTYTALSLRLEHGDAILELVDGVPDPEDPTSVLAPDTPFDLASVTKPFTATAILRLVAAGDMDLDAPVRRYERAFRGPGKDAVTVRHLLTHSAGLPPLVRLFGAEAPEGDPWEVVFDTPLAYAPGEKVVYSDVAFILLGRLVSTVAGAALPAAMQALVLGPLELGNVRYGPCPAAPATEFDPWRGRRIRGEVHDENAYVLGGAAGHAGLFGTANAVARLSQIYLDPDSGFLPAALSRQSISPQVEWGEERRGLGWDLRSPSPDAPEAPFSESTFGHYGFTGNAVWTDPDRDVTLVLLTNRVYFGRDPDGIRRLRREVFSAVAAAFPR